MRRRSIARFTIFLFAYALLLTSILVCPCIGKERSSISISASPTTVMIGENITLSGSINVTHVGVTVYLLHRKVGKSWTPLDDVTTNDTSQYAYDWDTTSTEAGTHEVKAYWLGDADTYGNESSPITVEIIGVHDLAVQNVVPSSTEVIAGEPVDVDVTIKNEGDYTETFDVHVYGDINTTVIGDEIDVGTLSGVKLSFRGLTVRVVTWNTTGVPEGTYTMSGEVSQVLGEANATNNMYTDGTVSVAYPEEPPVANFTYSPEIPTTKLIIFNASGSYDPDGSIISYFWTFGDGTNATRSSATIDHAYADNGTYTVVLNVTDDDGLSDTASLNVMVLNSPPIVIFTQSPEEVYINEIIYFNASDSEDWDGSIVSYWWDFGDGTNATGVTAQHSYPLKRNYTVTLSVTDDEGATNSTSANMMVLNSQPYAVFTESAEEVFIDQIIRFNASESHDSDGLIVDYAWDFGDGTNASMALFLDHVYVDEGNHTVTLTVTDDGGASSSVSATILVTASEGGSWPLDWIVGLASGIVVLAGISIYALLRRRR